MEKWTPLIVLIVAMFPALLEWLQKLLNIATG